MEHTHKVRGHTRYAVHFEVDVVTARAELVSIPVANLSRGGALLTTRSPEQPGSEVVLLLHPSPRGLPSALALSGRVVHNNPLGMGIQFKESTVSGAALLEAFVARLAHDEAQRATPIGPPLGKVLAVARSLFAGLERHDPYAAVGLAPGATDQQVAERLAGLARMLSADRPDVSPPQRARLDAACRAVVRLEGEIAERAAALHRQAELSVVTRSMEQVRLLYDDAAREERRGDLLAARRLLAQALSIAPHEDAARPVRAAITRLTSTLDGKRACELLDSAEVFVDGVGMREDASRLAREAARLSPLREVQLRALRVLAKSGEGQEAIEIARELIVKNPNDPLALQAMLHLHERADRLSLALRAGRQLQRQRPDDEELRARLERLAARVAASGRQR